MFMKIKEGDALIRLLLTEMPRYLALLPCGPFFVQVEFHGNDFINLDDRLADTVRGNGIDVQGKSDQPLAR